MNDLLHQLIDLIRDEEQVLSRFLECLTRQKEFIVKNDVDAFDATVQEEEALILRVREIEKARVKLVASIARSAGALADDLTLTRLIELNLGENSDELRALKRTLAGLVDRVKRAIRVNQYLIRRSLSFIERNMEWFIDDADLGTVYASDGRRHIGERGNVLVDKSL